MTNIEPLRVLIAAEPGIDGVFRCVETLVRRLLTHAVEVHFAYSSLRGGPALAALVRDVEAAGGRTTDLCVGNSPGPADGRALLQLWRLARAVRPHVVHGHSSKAGGLVRLLPLLGVRAPIFYTPHAYYLMHQPLDVKGTVLTAIERLLGRIGTTMHVSQSEMAYGRDKLGLAPERQIVRSNGVDCARFRPAANPAERARLRAGFGWPADALVLGTIARYSEQKAPLTLYRAVLDALKADPLLHFAHVGDGVLRPEADRLIAASPHRARIHQLPSVAEPPSFYQALDGFILPSRYEGLALAGLEGLAAGLPMILTDCPGNDDLKNYGLDSVHWTAVDDVPALVAAIGAWARESRAGRATNHREAALRAFDSAGCCDLILETYRVAAERA